MSYYLRGTRVAYSNIAVGAATGQERTIIGTSLSSEYDKERVISSTGGDVSTPSTATARNRMIASSGAGVTTLHPRECVISTQ